MKRLLAALLALPLCLFVACGKGNDEDYEYTMLAEITKIEEKIEVEVKESPVAEGIYLVNTSNDTAFEDAKGKRIKRENLSVGDTVLIAYTGQVMMSIPPQIIALAIILQ